jgi:hypothetical protein
MQLNFRKMSSIRKEASQRFALSRVRQGLVLRNPSGRYRPPGRQKGKPVSDFSHSTT